MVFTNKIFAIKAVRELGTKATIEKNPTTSIMEIRLGTTLKECKDLTEAIMELGVRRFLEEELTKLAKGENPRKICGAQDASGKWLCNLTPSHGGGVHKDHVSGRHFEAGGYEIPDPTRGGGF